MKGVYPRSEETRKRMSLAQRSLKKRLTDGTRLKISLAKRGQIPWIKGKRHTPQTRKKISDAVLKNPTRHWLGKRRPDISREKSHLWRGGSRLDKSVRSLMEYKRWRSDVFQRDGWICQTCGASGQYVEAHHKKSFSKIMRENNIKSIDDAIECKELWDLKNGVTLCKPCHEMTDNYRTKAI